MIKKTEFTQPLNCIFTCIILLAFLLTACKKSTKATSTSGVSPDAVNTAAAQTAEARRNQTGSQTPTNPPLPTFDTTAIAATQAAATQLAQITPSAVVTATIMPPTSAVTSTTPTLTPPPPTGLDNGVFTGKETIPDGTDFAPGAKFTKSWQFMNNGQTTWTTAYNLVFVSGDKMGGPDSVPVKIEVQSGRVVDIAVDLVAPEKTGTYKGNWRLRNTAGQVFGDIVYVQIDVVEGGGTSPTGTTTASGKVKSVTLTINKTSHTGKCPYTFTFTAELTVKGETTATYKLEFGGITAPPTSAETTTFSDGTIELTFSPSFTVSGSGWARLHVTAPNDISSNQVEFSLTCEP
jgi:Ig-like domain from next to BRCA1 gene